MSEKNSDKDIVINFLLFWQMHWLKVDFNKWVDEDDLEEEEAGPGDDYDLSQVKYQAEYHIVILFLSKQNSLMSNNRRVSFG